MSLLFGWFLTIRSHSDDRCGSEKIINPVWDLSFRLFSMDREDSEGVGKREKFLLSYSPLPLFLHMRCRVLLLKFLKSSFLRRYTLTLLAPVDRWRSRLHSKNYDFLQWQPRWVSFFLCGGAAFCLYRSICQDPYSQSPKWWNNKKREIFN